MKALPALQFILLFWLLLSASRLSAAEPEVILLWPNGAPGSESQTAKAMGKTSAEE